MVTPTSDSFDRLSLAIRDITRALLDAEPGAERAHMVHLLEAFATGVLLAGDYSAAGIEAAAGRLLDQARTVVPPSLAPEIARCRLALVPVEQVGSSAPLDVRALVNDVLAGKDAQR